MARKSYGRTSSLLNVGTYQDDDSYPVGSNEWNANHSDDGIIGFDKSAQPISGNNNINVTDSFIEITTADSASGGSNDGIYTLAAITTAHSATNYPADTSNSNVKLRSNASSYSEGDLIYVVKAAGQGATTLRHQQGGAGAGKITTLDGEHKLLSATVPTILMARIINSNVEWIEYGGGAVTVPTAITVGDESNDVECFPLFSLTATGDILPKTGTNLKFNSSTGLLTASLFAGSLASCTALPAAQVSQGTMVSGMVLVAPVLGTPASGDLQNCTALPAAQVTQGTMASGMVLVAPVLGTPASGNLATCTFPTLNQSTSGTAAIATAVTITDNENSNETNAIVFTSGGTATGNLGLESDGDLTYNPLTGIVTVPALTIAGNLIVNGTTTTINSTVTTLDDPIITLGGDTAPASDDNKDRGVEFRWYTGGAAKVGYFGFNDSNSRFMFIGDATNSSEVFSGTLGDAEFGTVYGALSGNATTATTVAQAAQTTITSVGELTGLTMSSATSHIDLDGANLENGGVIFLKEQTEADSSQTAKGQLWVDTATPNKLMFTDDADTDFDLTAGGGDSLLHSFSNGGTSVTSVFTVSTHSIAFEAGTAVGTQAAGLGIRDIYVRKIDTNNEGVFALIHKNGTIAEVQIA